jgi:hypothetical protein
MSVAQKLWTATLVVAGVFIVTLVAAGAFVFPAAAAVACPACYGFEQAERQVYVERNASSTQRLEVERAVTEARDRVSSFYGGLLADPRLLICVSERCYQRLGGGGARGMALLSFALVLSKRGVAPITASHELSHIELHRRLGLWRTWLCQIPQWFDEGVAVVVSDDPRYLGAPNSPDRCLVSPDGSLPSGRADWIESAASQQLYARAACRVIRWMPRNNGAASVLDLISRVADGTPFDVAYATPAVN